MNVVKEVEMEMAKDVADGSLNHEYPPMGGSQELVALTAELIFGKKSRALAEGLVGYA